MTKNYVLFDPTRSYPRLATLGEGIRGKPLHTYHLIS